MPKPISYQLEIAVGKPSRIPVGRLGTINLPAGRYVYTGSARRALESRVARHLRGTKRLRWHIDYLLRTPDVDVLMVHRSSRPECSLNQSTRGRIVAPGFGSSDCRAGCGSHLKYIGKVDCRMRQQCKHMTFAEA